MEPRLGPPCVIPHTRTTNCLPCPWCGFAAWNCACRSYTITLQVPDQVWIELDFIESFERLVPATTIEAEIPFNFRRPVAADWTVPHRRPPVRAPPVDAAPLPDYPVEHDPPSLPRPRRAADPDRQRRRVLRHGDVGLRPAVVDREVSMMHFLAGCGFVLLLYVFLAAVKRL